MLFGFITVFAGSSVLLGVDPGYIVFRPLVIYNSVMGIVYIAAVFFAVGNGLMWPSFLSYLSKIAGIKLQGSVQGFASSFGSIASIIGLILGGLIYSFIGVFVFLISSFVIFFVVILSIKLINIEKKLISNEKIY